MIDTLTKEPLQVKTSGSSPEKMVAYLRFPASQVEDIKAVLDRHKVPYWVAESYFSFNGGPFMAKIYFRSWVDPKDAQAALDSVS